MNQGKEDVLTFAAILNQEVREQAFEGSPYDTEIECFGHKVIELFEDAGVMQDAHVCVSAGRIGRADWALGGYGFPPAEEEDLTEVSILALAHFDSREPPPVPAVELRSTFEKAVHFVAQMLEGKADLLEPAAEAAALGRTIYERRRQLRTVKVHLATDGLTQRLREIESVSIGRVEVTCTIWDIERLSRLGDPRQEEIEIIVPELLNGERLPCLRVPEEDPDYDAYLCVVPGRLLYMAYEKYGQRLLELNVRSFLSTTGKVNKGIKETIEKAPDRFFIYNNGLALTARSVTIVKDSQGREYVDTIVGLQVVNGGQTTASIHRAWKVDRLVEQIDKLFVQAKLTVITTNEEDLEGFSDLVRSISRFANSQNAVKTDDLEANQPWQVAMEKLSRENWTPDASSQWYYERARGSYAVSKSRFATTPAKRAEFERRWPRNQLITKTDLAKAMNAWDQHPDAVSLGGQKNFVALLDRLGHEQLQNPTLDSRAYKVILGKVILFRDTTKLVKSLKQQIPAYQANVVAYLVSYLSYRMPEGLDFEKIWEKQATSQTILTTLGRWAEDVYRTIVISADGRNVTEWCKKADCWKTVASLMLPSDAPFDRFSSSHGVGFRLELADLSDASAIALCKSLTSEEWDRLMTWSGDENSVHFKVRQILSTVRTYAYDNWKRPPSAKQARSVSKAIQKWKEQGGG